MTGSTIAGLPVTPRGNSPPVAVTSPWFSERSQALGTEPGTALPTRALNMTRSRTDGYSEAMIVRSRGKLLARALAVFFAAAILAELAHVALARDLAGNDAPDFALRSVAGNNIRLSEYRSDVVAVAFWASWCGDCRSGLPVLEKLQQQLGADGLRVLGVSFDKDVPAARESATAARVSFPVLMDPDGEVGRLYDVGDLPLVVLIDRGGRVRQTYKGGRAATEQALAKEIRALLAE